jgi:hypothetical protein
MTAPLTFKDEAGDAPARLADPVAPARATNHPPRFA